MTSFSAKPLASLIVYGTGAVLLRFQLHKESSKIFLCINKILIRQTADFFGLKCTGLKLTIVHNIIYLIIKSNIVIFVELVITTCMIIYSFRYSNIITPTMHKDTVYLLDSFLVDNTVFGGRLWWIKYHSQRFSPIITLVIPILMYYRSTIQLYRG